MPFMLIAFALIVLANGARRGTGKVTAQVIELDSYAAICLVLGVAQLT